MNTGKRSSPLPDDVLVIPYARLSPDPLTRLQTAAAIGRLLNVDGGSQPLAELSPSSASTRAIREWLAGEEAVHFWRVDGDLVTVERPCEKHVLVGTSLLLQDLSAVTNTTLPPRLEEIDLVWRAAGRLLERDHTE